MEPLPPPLPSHSSAPHRAPSTTEPAHWALGTGHWARGTGHGARRLSDVSSTSRPLYSNFRTHTHPPSVSPRPLDAADTGSAHFSSPALISTPQNTRLAFVTRTWRGSLISPTPQLRQIKGLVATRSPASPSPVPFSPARPIQVVMARRSSTPLPPFGIGPPDISYVSLVICGRHGSRYTRHRTRPSYLGRLLAGTTSLYELRSHVHVWPTPHAQFLRACMPWIRRTPSVLCVQVGDRSAVQHVQGLSPQCRILLKTPQFVSLHPVGGCRLTADMYRSLTYQSPKA
jgi:hypothetical protein